VKNRVVRTAHATNLGRGKINEDLIAYHVARAKGGVGLTIVELLPVHESCFGFLNHFRTPGTDDGCRALTEAIRPQGMRVFQQLWHGGHVLPPSDGSAPWSASDIPNPLNGLVPLPMTKMMIDEIVESFAQAGAKCQEWGYDGVDIHCGHGYLVHQFMSPATNRRSDNYGGSVENRARFLLEVLAAVRSAVSPEFVVGARFSPDMASGGLDAESVAAFARMADERQLIDYINISAGSSYDLAAMAAGMDRPTGYELPTSSVIGAAVIVPRIVIGRFRTLEEADQVIREGTAEFVGMVRATIADPDLVNKTLAGSPESVRPCIGCSQGCLGGLLGPAGRMGCEVNPQAGKEARQIAGSDAEHPSRPRVLVVGGGPAGLEAARTAAERQCAVTLMEAMPSLGGQIELASRVPHRYSIKDITLWLEQEVYRLGVDVRLNTYVDTDDIGEDEFDSVILATGSVPRMDGIQASNPGEPIVGMHLPHVMSSHDLLSKPDFASASKAVVYDDIGHYEALGVAEFLAERGTAVTLVTRHHQVGPLLEPAFVTEPTLRRLYQCSFQYHVRSRLVAIERDRVFIAPTYSKRTFKIDADLIVVVTANRAQAEMAAALAERPFKVHTIGDAYMPGFLGQAIAAGRNAGQIV
jgi:2,4-dienoyl-CoA reductase-like NADH-dependent reductase (Old Yellow Enzyme family)/thioredoxin reductase